jgi:predicted dehydrogenase
VPEFAFAAAAVRSGEYGRLLAAQFLRVISRPDWSADIGDADKTGGPAIDLHIHDTHFIGLLCGVPGRVFSTGVEENGAVAHLTTQYLYGPGGPAVTCTSGALAQKGRPFVHGFEIYLEKATLLFESGVKPLTVLDAAGGTTRPAVEGGDPTAAFTVELQAAVDGVRTGREPDLLSGQLARDALVLCQRECESVRSGAVAAVV